MRFITKTLGVFISLFFWVGFHSFLVNDRVQRSEFLRIDEIQAPITASRLAEIVDFPTTVDTRLTKRLDEKNDAIASPFVSELSVATSDTKLTKELDEMNHVNASLVTLESSVATADTKLTKKLDEKDDKNLSLFVPELSLAPAPLQIRLSGSGDAPRNNNTPTDVVTATVRDANEQQPAPAMSQDQADFYLYHYEQMQKLFQYRSSVMYWGTRDKFKPFWGQFDKNLLWKLNKVESKSQTMDFAKQKHKRYVKVSSICMMARAFLEYRNQPNSEPLPHVLFFRFNENWGGFSQQVPGKTAEWVPNLIKTWKKQGCNYTTIFQYINHPETLAAVTTQFQIFDHPKVHSLPLGITAKKKIDAFMEYLKLYHKEPRTQLIMVNCKSRPMRKASIEAVIRNFNGTVRNTFGKLEGDEMSFYREMLRSKFILSPGGLGFDCYRHWEAIHMGTIPVIEHLNRTDGWLRVFQDLPVLLVDSHDNVTPELLEREYERIISKAKSYRYEKLTSKYWINFIKSHFKD